MTNGALAVNSPNRTRTNDPIPAKTKNSASIENEFCFMMTPVSMGGSGDSRACNTSIAEYYRTHKRPSSISY